MAALKWPQLFFSYLSKRTWFPRLNFQLLNVCFVIIWLCDVTTARTKWSQPCVNMLQFHCLWWQAAGLRPLAVSCHLGRNCSKQKEQQQNAVRPKAVCVWNSARWRWQLHAIGSVCDNVAVITNRAAKIQTLLVVEFIQKFSSSSTSSNAVGNVTVKWHKCSASLVLLSMNITE